MLLLSLDPDSQEPLQEQLVGQLIRQIGTGQLAPGHRLPSTRALARDLGLSRNTVALAYERLAAEGYVTGRTGAGTFVARELPDDAMHANPAQEPPATSRCGDSMGRGPRPCFDGRRHVLDYLRDVRFDFAVQRADPRAFPLKAWRRILANCLVAPGAQLTDYGDPAGLKELRVAIAGHIAAARGIAVGPEQVFVVAGAQLGLNLVTRLYLREGHPVVVEDPCNQGAAFLFEALGCRLHPVPLDAEGLRADRLPEVEGALVYTTPSHQFPMGVGMSLARRQALLDWAERTGSLIVEDDYDSHFVYRGPPVPSLKAMRPDLVVHLGTFSKSLGAGLRMGFAIVPESLVDKTTAAKALLDNGPPWLEQSALARFISEGSYDRHIRRLRQSCLVRRDALLDALQAQFGRIAITGENSGTHIVWHLPPDFPTARRVQAAARRRKVGVYTLDSGGGHEYGVQNLSERALMLGFSAIEERHIRAGVAQLAAAVEALRRETASEAV